MNYASSGLFAAGLSLCLFSSDTVAAEIPAAYNAAASEALRDIPVHIVLLNDELEVQLNYAYTSVDPYLQPFYNNPAYSSIPGMSTGAGIAAGALGAALGSALANAAQYEAAERAAVPGYAQLQRAHCKLPAATSLAAGLERSVRTSSWGSATPVRTLNVDKGQRLNKLLDEDQARHVLVASYSMSPDFSTVITSLNLGVYSDAIEGAPKRWQDKQAWSNLLVVFSEQMLAPPKTKQDIADLIASENERFALTPANELILAANKGDQAARKQAFSLVSTHEQYLREAKKEKWTAAQLTARNSRHWVADECAPLSAAIEANARELESLLERLYAGELPAPLPADTSIRDVALRNMEPDAAPTGARVVTAELGSTFISRPAGGTRIPYQLHTWYTP